MDEHENVIGFETLYRSMEKCKCGVMWKDSVAHYYLNALEETLKLEQQLKSCTYRQRATVSFQITAPKPRDVISIAFRDRVYQRSLNDNSIYPQMSRSLIYDNKACQKGKGTDNARTRLKEFLRKYYLRHGTKGYALQCDVKGYYAHIPHDSTTEMFRKKLDPWTAERGIEVLDSQYSGDTGYNPGSQMVQIVGISTLSPADHYAKEKLRAKYYIRYMDDFVIISSDKGYLEHCKDAIAQQLYGIGLSYNEKKTSIYPLSDGIMFLGFRFRLTKDGKVLMILNPDNVKRERRKLSRLVNKYKHGETTKEKVYECYNGWKNHAEHGNSTLLIARMDAYLKEMLEVKDVSKAQ